ncbi:unnamed protein product [Closterium sp. NIES-54]
MHNGASRANRLRASASVRTADFYRATLDSRSAVALAHRRPAVLAGRLSAVLARLLYATLAGGRPCLAAAVVEVAAGVVVGAAVEVMAAVGLVEGVGALVAAVEAAVGVVAVAAVGLVAVGLELSVLVLEVACVSSSSVGARPSRSFVSGFWVWRLGVAARIAAAALGASESGTLLGTAPAQALHTFTLDSGASAFSFVTAP